MSSDERQLGKVEKVDLFREDHGLLTVYVHLRFAGSGQGFGGFVLDTFDKARDRRVGTAMGLDFVLRLLALFDVDRLDAIAGRYVYALREGGWNSPIIGLELPEPDGGGRFMVADWQREWAPTPCDCTAPEAAVVDPREWVRWTDVINAAARVAKGLHEEALTRDGLDRTKAHHASGGAWSVHTELATLRHAAAPTEAPR